MHVLKLLISHKLVLSLWRPIQLLHCHIVPQMLSNVWRKTSFSCWTTSSESPFQKAPYQRKCHVYRKLGTVCCTLYCAEPHHLHNKHLCLNFSTGAYCKYYIVNNINMLHTWHGWSPLVLWAGRYIQTRRQHVWDSYAEHSLALSCLAQHLHTGIHTEKTSLSHQHLHNRNTC